MSGQNVIPLDQRRRARSASLETRGTILRDSTIAMIILVSVQAMMFVGMVSVFMLTRAVAGGAWPPDGQARFSLEETALSTAALLASGALVYLASQAWGKREARVGPLLLGAISLGAFFVFFQGTEWVALIRQGLSPMSTQHGTFFCLILGLYGAHALGALLFMGVAWVRLKRGSLSSGAFSAALIPWYFAVGVWPVLYLSLYL